MPQGGTIIGRSLDCHHRKTRSSCRHARIVVDETGARIEDMGSRNGVRVNGAVIHEPVALRNGDRVRIGTQDFVFCCVDPAGRAHSRTTGQLRLCANCRLPYPRELLACPNCEATEQTDDDTLTGSGPPAAHVVERPSSWSSPSNAPCASRASRTPSASCSGPSPRSKKCVDGRESRSTSGCLAAFSPCRPQRRAWPRNDPAWAHWVLDVYGRIGRVPSLEVIERVGEIAGKHAHVLHAKRAPSTAF